MGKLKQPQGIVVHHSATPDQDVLDYPAILRYHIGVNNWSDVGYHALVEQTDRGTVCIFGRPTDQFGAHASGYNDHLGICFIGNFDRLLPPGMVVDEAVKRVVIPWCRQFGLTAAQIRGHRELPGVHKTCPGTAFDMDQFRSYVEALL